ncbi:excinuclease ABC subunit UvrC [Facilibium subflavum]|uniref:excinuclease ABC subunit UvrC n=1 Tax=Facilibium subflavum TaxID=2219058 RepID=UPI000E6513DF|nr:excinuclease ABC subunit UvrC [Facilibium subflavum]
MFLDDFTFDLESFLKNVSTHPGVYRMYDKQGNIIYVGKAKNLNKRINSYFSKGAKDLKTQSLVAQIHYIDITVTPSEYEAYLLESSLIKKHKPKYNILFKDDKSYPYLALSHHDFPRLYGFRGKPDKKATYFGPYVSLASMRETLVLLQKIFPVRQCEDSYYKARTRPCLQYQIKRCSAPCVNKISKETYAEQVDLLKRFIQGKLSSVLEEVSNKMHQAAEQHDFEKAAMLRDQLTILTKIQQQQIIDQVSLRSFHVIGIASIMQKACVSLLEISQGKVEYDRHWFIDIDMLQEKEDVISAFLLHYYLSDQSRNLWPEQVILPEGSKVSSSLLSAIEKKAGAKLQWLIKTTGINAKWQKLAMVNAKQKLQSNLQSLSQYAAKFTALQTWLNIEEIRRIECFDISHHQGEATVASCVVYEKQGPVKSAYRRYNIEGVTAGDDYTAISQALHRRLSSGVQADNLPDVIVIDGGKGQLHKAEQALLQFDLQNTIQLVSLGKGVERISGKEVIYRGFDSTGYHLPAYDLAFLLLRQIRDSAHDFAITGQRKKVAKRQTESILEQIPGIGAKRRKALLTHFGGWQGLTSASASEIAKVSGISAKMADMIWHALH